MAWVVTPTSSTETEVSLASIICQILHHGPASSPRIIRQLCIPIRLTNSNAQAVARMPLPSSTMGMERVEILTSLRIVVVSYLSTLAKGSWSPFKIVWDSQMPQIQTAPLSLERLSVLYQGHHRLALWLKTQLLECGTQIRFDRPFVNAIVAREMHQVAFQTQRQPDLSSLLMEPRIHSLLVKAQPILNHSPNAELIKSELIAQWWWWIWRRKHQRLCVEIFFTMAATPSSQVETMAFLPCVAKHRKSCWKKLKQLQRNASPVRLSECKIQQSYRLQTNK